MESQIWPLLKSPLQLRKKRMSWFLGANSCEPWKVPCSQSAGIWDQTAVEWISKIKIPLSQYSGCLVDSVPVLYEPRSQWFPPPFPITVHRAGPPLLWGGKTGEWIAVQNLVPPAAHSLWVSVSEKPWLNSILNPINLSAVHFCHRYPSEQSCPWGRKCHWQHADHSQQMR